MSLRSLSPARLVRSILERRKAEEIRATWPEEVRRAMAMPGGTPEQPVCPALTSRIKEMVESSPQMTSKDLFSLGEKKLPCWLAEDEASADDNWLHAESYYPLYYRLIRGFLPATGRSRFLEIGVRTGYMAVVSFRASRSPLTYFGVDPNIYVRNGLVLASSSLDLLRQGGLPHDFCLLQGFSWDPDLQATLGYSKPFHLIHIDGDHTLDGKLFDLFLASQLVSDSGYVIVDDFDFMANIKEAVQRSLSRKWFSKLAYVKTHRGLGVLTR